MDSLEEEVGVEDDMDTEQEVVVEDTDLIDIL